MGFILNNQENLTSITTEQWSSGEERGFLWCSRLQVRFPLAPYFWNFFFVIFFQVFFCEKSFACKSTKYAEKTRKNSKNHEIVRFWKMRQVALSVILIFVYWEGNPLHFRIVRNTRKNFCFVLILHRLLWREFSSSAEIMRVRVLARFASVVLFSFSALYASAQ